MKKLLFVFVCCFHLFPAKAQYTDIPEPELGSIKEIEKPTCDDALFIQKAKAAIKNYLEAQKISSIIAQRKNLLRQLKINHFEQIDAETIDYQKDYFAANALMMIKINKQIDETDILVCKQKSKDKNPIYLIAYPFLDNFKVDVINLIEHDNDYERVSFIYP